MVTTMCLLSKYLAILEVRLDNGGCPYDEMQKVSAWGEGGWAVGARL